MLDYFRFGFSSAPYNDPVAETKLLISRPLVKYGV
jgi:hypothetical protein